MLPTEHLMLPTEAAARRGSYLGENIGLDEADDDSPDAGAPEVTRFSDPVDCLKQGLRCAACPPLPGL